jgi:hypothetical protein
VLLISDFCLVIFSLKDFYQEKCGDISKFLHSKKFHLMDVAMHGIFRPLAYRGAALPPASHVMEEKHTGCVTLRHRRFAFCLEASTLLLLIPRR